MSKRFGSILQWHIFCFKMAKMQHIKWLSVFWMKKNSQYNFWNNKKNLNRLFFVLPAGAFQCYIWLPGVERQAGYHHYGSEVRRSPACCSFGYFSRNEYFCFKKKSWSQAYLGWNCGCWKWVECVNYDYRQNVTVSEKEKIMFKLRNFTIKVL